MTEVLPHVEGQTPSVVEDAEGVVGGDGALNPSDFEGPNLEALWEGQIDDEALKQAEGELLLPVGWYTTIPGSFKGKLVESEFDPERPIASFFGRITLTKEGGEVVTGAQGYRISPMRRDGTKEENGTRVSTGKPDFKHNLFIQAANAYAKAYGERATKPGEVLAYLNDFPHQIRVTKTQDNRNLVVAIRAVPEQE